MSKVNKKQDSDSSNKRQSVSKVFAIDIEAYGIANAIKDHILAVVDAKIQENAIRQVIPEFSIGCMLQNAEISALF